VSRNRLDLDFSGRPRRGPGLGLVLLAAGAVLVLLATARVAEALTARAANSGSLAELEAAANRNTARPAPKGAVNDPRLAARNAVNRQVAHQLESPWADLLEVIEVHPDGKVALLAVEPSAIKRTVHITAEARDVDAMLEHLSLLQKDPRLVDVVLVSHQRQTQAPGAPWRYQIQGSW
jgi:Tfp pilus assembly protein PilN